MANRTLAGEWSDTINAFWMGANNCEFIAWKGSHQIFVYPCDEHPQPPCAIYQHTKRIKTLEDFNDALDNRSVYNVTYSERPIATVHGSKRVEFDRLF